MKLEQKIAKYLACDCKVVANGYNSFTNIYDCANSHYSEGTVCHKCTHSNKNSHQFRLNNNSLEKFAAQVEKELQSWAGIDSFEELLARIKDIIEKTKKESGGKDKLGDLVAYDCSARIAYLKYMQGEGDYRPTQYVHIHAGVYDGAIWLFEHDYITKKPKRNNVLPIEEFNEGHFKPLFDALNLSEFKGFTKSMILESFMCMMEKEVKRRNYISCKKCRLRVE